MFVYVINKHGKPLMPCKPQKERKPLTAGKAKVVNHEPFTIQLLFGSSGYRQSVTLGIDAGSVHIGASASTKKQELYASAKGERWYIRGLRSKSSFVLKKLDGTKLEIMPSKISFGWHNKSYLVERRSAAPLAVKTASTRRANY